MALVELSISEGIAVITLNNPPVNVLSREVGRQLRTIVDQLSEQTDVFAVVVTGAGRKAFMAGGDIKEFPEYIEHHVAEEAALEFDETLTRLSELPFPVIAALCGHALGGGCELALACDFRIAESQCMIGQPEITLGVLPGAGGTQRLARLIGPARAKRFVLTGESVSASKAYEFGLVDELVDTGEGLIAAHQFASKFQTKSRVALRMAKQAIDEGLKGTLEDGLRMEARLFGEAFETYDAREGIAAFVEKRQPRFLHR